MATLAMMNEPPGLSVATDATYRLERWDGIDELWVEERETGPLYAMIGLLVAHSRIRPTVGWRLQPCLRR